MQARATRSRRAPASGRPAACSGRLIAGLVALLALGCATVGLITYLAIQAPSRRTRQPAANRDGIWNSCLDHGGADGNGRTTGAAARPSVSPHRRSPLLTPTCGLGPGTLTRTSVTASGVGYVVRDRPPSRPPTRHVGAITPRRCRDRAAQPAAVYRGPLLADSGGELHDHRDRRSDGGTYITGLPLGGVHDMLTTSR